MIYHKDAQDEGMLNCDLDPFPLTLVKIFAMVRKNIEMNGNTSRKKVLGSHESNLEEENDNLEDGMQHLHFDASFENLSGAVPVNSVK